MKTSVPITIMGRQVRLVENDIEIDPLTASDEDFAAVCTPCAFSGFLGHCEALCVDLALKLDFDPFKCNFKKL